MILSKRATSLEASPTVAITSKAKILKAQGKDVISFGAGEPDFDTPDFIKKAAIEAINNGFTKYTPPAGILELREAIAKKLVKENKLDYNFENVVVTDGAKYALFLLFLSLLEEGDGVIVLSPYWVSYIEQVKFTGASCVIIDTKEDDFYPNEKKIEEVIKAIQREKEIPSFARLVGNYPKKIKAIIINTPNNPTGAVYPKEILEKVAQVCLKHNVYIVSDECYEKLIYEGYHTSIGSLDKDILDITFTINAFSKAYSMTGWRVGYIAAKNKDVINAIIKIISQSTSNVCSISQKAAVAALKGPQDFLKTWKRAFIERRDYMCNFFKSLDIPFVKPQGAFYLFVDFSKVIKSKNFKDDINFAKSLLEEKLVALVPGSAFGAPNFARLSYATSLENIKKGLERIKEFIKGN